MVYPLVQSAGAPPPAPVWALDWHQMLIPTVGLVELVVRGSVMYLGVLFLMRLFRRNQGSLNTADLLVLVMVADAAQNAMSAQYNSITEGAVLICTIFAWNYLLDWVSYHSPLAHRLLHPASLPLIQNGRINYRNLRAELLTRGDLLEQLREQGIEGVSDVAKCCLEADGHISIIKKEPGADDQHERKRAVL